MSTQRRPAVTDVVVVALAVSLVVAAWFVLTPRVDRAGQPYPSDLPPAGAPRTPPADTPTPGPGFPVRPAGQIPAAGLTVQGRGNSEVRYARFPGNPTRVQFSCPTCTTPTWLVDLARPHPLGGGPLTTPKRYDDVVDYIDPGPRNRLLVKVRTGAAWTLVLTPFDALPVQTATVDRRDTTFVRVSTSGPVTLRCPPTSFVKTFARPPGATEYDVRRVIREDTEDTVTIDPPHGTDPWVLLITCAGPWTLTLR